MREITPIHGAWSDEANGWVSDIVKLTGDAWLEIELSDKGRVVIKKGVPRGCGGGPGGKTAGHSGCPYEGTAGCCFPCGRTAGHSCGGVMTFPKALITPWTGPKFKIRLYGSTRPVEIIIVTTSIPKTIEYANI